MPDPRSPPGPDKPDDRPKPNAPKDPSVYGGNWGGDDKTPGPQAPDRPDKIKAPPGPQGEAEP
jgi:hypothetical protein